MSEKRASLEVIAPTVEEAISKGLDDLGLPEDAVEVEILDSGSRGLFGIGSRQARIRLTIRSTSAEVSAAPVVEPAAPVQPARAEKTAPAYEAEEEWETDYEEDEADSFVEEEAPVVEAGLTERVAAVAGDEQTLRVASETVMELLEKMKVKATVSASYGEAEDAHSKVPVQVDVRGNDLSILIGPRAETLNALQYIAALIVGKELGRSVPLVVDVEGYRSRRAAQLRQLARRMADQAIKTGKRQVLEPMPANERRLIHIELRSNPNVDTQSIGEEPRRKVTIVPVK